MGLSHETKPYDAVNLPAGTPVFVPFVVSQQPNSLEQRTALSACILSICGQKNPPFDRQIEHLCAFLSWWLKEPIQVK
ncbi:hypothetical protein ACFL6U_04310 [Planctomycetota bacterium]